MSEKEEARKGISFITMILLFLLLGTLITSCGTIKPKQITKKDVKEEYILEIIDQEFCIIYSNLTKRTYKVKVEQIHEALEFDNL